MNLQLTLIETYMYKSAHSETAVKQMLCEDGFKNDINLEFPLVRAACRVKETALTEKRKRPPKAHTHT
jgi:hypothetical protein